MNHREHTAKDLTSRVGFLAALRALIGLKGSGARSLVSSRLGRRASAALGGTLAVLSLAAVLTPIAAAATAHGFSDAFGGPGEGAGQLELLATGTEALTGGVRFIATGPDSGIAVDDASGDLYVADTGNHRISEFDSTRPPAESFLRAFGFGVADGTSAELQTCTTTCHRGLPGTAPGQLSEPVLIAVDNDPTSPSHGDVYVGDVADGLITKYDAEGHLIETWGNDGPLETPDGRLKGPPGESFGHLSGIAVDGGGRLLVLVADGSTVDRGRLLEFDQAGGLLAGLETPEGEPAPLGLAVDPAGNLYSVRYLNIPVEKYGPAGEALGTVDGTEAATGVTTEFGAGILYVAEGDHISKFALSCTPTQIQPGAKPTAGCPVAEIFGTGHLGATAGLAVDAASTVYVADPTADRIAVFPASLEGETGAATGLGQTSATLHATVDPTGTALSECVFQYGRSTAYEKSVPCETEGGTPIGSGNSPVAVHADLKGLTGATLYHFRLHASNVAEAHLAGEDESFETLASPLIEEVGATEITAGSATLTAKVNPRGSETTYSFEYDTAPYVEGEGPHGTQVPLGGESIGSGLHGVSVSQAITGLSPGTTYYYRLAAGDHCNSAAPAEVCALISPEHSFVYLTEPVAEPERPCPNEALRTGLSARLPDCRAYEQVSPTQKNGALLAHDLGRDYISISPDGSEVITRAVQCFDAAVSCTALRGESVGQPVAFGRSSSGWLPTSLGLPASRFPVDSALGYDAGRGAALLTAPDPGGEETIYWSLADGSTVEVGRVVPGEGVTRLNEALASADLSHLLFSTAGKWPFDHTEDHQHTYEYVGDNQTEPLLVEVGGPEGGLGSTDLICRSNAERFEITEQISAEGRTIIFDAGPCSGGTGANAGTPVPSQQLFARVDGEMSDAHTVDLSERSPVGCTGGCAVSRPGAAFFVGASTDDSKIYFLSPQRLTDNASEDPDSSIDTRQLCNEPPGPGGCNLYLYDSSAAAGHNLIDVSAGDTSGLGPEVQGVLTVSPDGSHVYFVAQGVLTGPNPEGKVPVEGAENLYAYQRDEAFPSGHVAFVATLSSAVHPEIGVGGTGNPTDREEFFGFSSAEPGVGPANVSPDGRYLVFTSHAPLTPDTTREGPAQVYRYDAATEELIRVSFGRRGFNDDGNAASPGVGAAVALEGSSRNTLGLQSSDPTMSRDASRIFFQSPTALVPGALNNVQIGVQEGLPEYAQNVYEWEQQGSGGCAEPTGCVSLISDGADTTKTLRRSSVELIGTEEEGKNVFFVTADRLAGTDTDTQDDIYDARVDGGFAEAPQPVPCASSEVCHAATTAAPPAGSPATPGFNGKEEGAKNPEQCKKGLVRKGSKCVKPSKHKGKHAKHHKKGNNKKSHKQTGSKHGGHK